jgi:O-antigen/teichoic acid export membrane protein
MEEIGSRTRQGVSLGFYVQIATQGIQFVFGLILARLLFPDQYGLVGMLAIFLALFEMLTDSGFGIAIIQKKTPSEDDYSTVFWFNFVFSLLLYVILFLLAPTIAAFYHEKKLVSILRVLGIVSVINSFGSIQGKYLNKNLKYMSLSKVYMVSFIIGSIVAVVFAYLGFGVWSLVIKSLATALLLNFGWWIVSTWKPKFKFSFSSLKQLFGFGSKMLGINIIEVLFNNLYSIIIGKFFNAQSLGFFTRAKQFCDLPDRTFRSSTISTLFNGLSHVQDDDEKLLRIYKKVLSLLSFVLFPLYAVLGVIAYPMIKILLTEKWLFSVGYLQILCIMAITYPFESVNGNLLYVKGKSNYLFIITVIRRIIFIVIIVTLVKYGVAALVWGLVLDAFIITFLYIIFATKVFNYQFIDQVRDVLPSFLITATSLLFMITAKSFIVGSLKQLFIIPIIGLSVYILLSYFFRRDNIKEVLNLIKFKK